MPCYIESCIYEKGDGDIPKDIPRARLLYEKAAQQGHSISQYNLAVLYETGQGGPQDLARARQLFSDSAAQGFPSAMCSLGHMCERGIGDNKPNIELAIDLYQQAIQLGHARAMYHMVLLKTFYYLYFFFIYLFVLIIFLSFLEKALLYAKGIGVTKDKKMAFDLYARSSMKGHAGALCDLGWMVLFTDSHI